MSIGIHRAGAMVHQAWANGAGSTREIARSPPQGTWDWRVSIATVERPAPFSCFPGVERELVLLSGAGLRLTNTDLAAEVVLDSPYARYRFAGEHSILGAPLGPTTLDFNLMWRRRVFDAQLWVRPMVGAMQLFVPPGQTWILHVAAGQAAVQQNGDALAMGDTLVVSGTDTMQRVAVDGAGMALVMQLIRR